MFYYIPSRNIMINQDHIIRATFSPARHIDAGSDEDGPHEARDIQASLELVLDEVESVEISQWMDGAPIAGSCQSKKLELKGNDATGLWYSMERNDSRSIPDY